MSGSSLVTTITIAYKARDTAVAADDAQPLMSTKATRKLNARASVQAASRRWVETLENRVLLAADLPHYGPDLGAGKGPGTPAVGAAAGVTGWTLLDAQTNDEIATFSTGAVINLRTLPTKNVNVRADTVGGPFTGVTFSLDGSSN